MTNLTVLPTPNYRHQRSEDTIDILKDLLARAETGEVQELAVAWINHEDRPSNKVSSSADMARLLGAIALLQYRMTQHMDEHADWVPDAPEAS